MLTVGLHNHHGERKQASGKYCKDYAVGFSEALTTLGSPTAQVVSASCAHRCEYHSESSCWDEIELCLSPRCSSIGHLIFVTHDPLARRMYSLGSIWWYPESTAQDRGRRQDQAGSITHMQTMLRLTDANGLRAAGGNYTSFTSRLP